MYDNTAADFKVGDRVQHVFHCNYGTVRKVGRKLLHIDADIWPYDADGRRFHTTARTTWRPDSVRRVD